MADKSGQACMVIADITGYTGYLAGVELDHAQDILADLIGAVVGALRPRFKLAKLEGDAAFCYVMAEALDAAVLQDAVEGTYFAFRKRLRDITQSTRCECNACKLMPKLDLKFVVHHGEIAHQRLAGRDELMGREVILIHRLLKNSVDKVLGAKPYALYTGACVDRMGIDPGAYGLIEHHEVVDIIGDVPCWVSNLEAAWVAHLAGQVVLVAQDATSFLHIFEVDAPRGAVWDFVTSPMTRPQWMVNVTDVKEVTSGQKRRGAGTLNHCMHGKEAVVEEVADWRPTDYFTVRYDFAALGVSRVVLSYVFIDLGDRRTRIELRLGQPAKARERAAMAPIVAVFKHSFEVGAANITGHFVARAAESMPEIAVELPVSKGRFASEPVAAGHIGHTH